MYRSTSAFFTAIGLGVPAFLLRTRLQAAAIQDDSKRVECDPASKSSWTKWLPFKASCTSLLQTEYNTDKGAKAILGDVQGKKGSVILVTGAAGFLGQHIVKLLQERADGIQEIRVLDSKVYRNNLGHVGVTPVRTIVGDIRCLADVREAVQGADSVIHTAGLVSFGTFPDIEAMEQVNVIGTANVIQACVEHNVPRLVYTSTVDVVIGYDDIINGDEALAVPKKFLFTGYPDTKHRAETLVTQANGRKLAKGDGSVLHTLSLRPNVMYGELDPYYVTSGLIAAKENNGTLLRIGDGLAKFQQAYVGNVAWAHLCAVASLRSDPGVAGGRSYFITDGTPIINTFDFMRPFLEARQFSVSDVAIPYPLVYAAFFMIDWTLWFLRPIVEINLKTALPSIIYVCRTLYFSRRRAEELLNYRPIYDYITSLDRSLAYYQHLPLDH